MFICIKRSTIAWCSLLCLLICGMIVSLSLGGGSETFFGGKANVTTKVTKQIPIYRVQTDSNNVALTFDASWGNARTQGILDCLKENETDATFFLVEFWAKENTELIKKMDMQGIEIGTHSSTHPHMSTLSREKIASELKSSCDALEKITKKRPTIFRPPYGDYNNMLLEVATEQRLKTIQWDVDTLDWKKLSASVMTKRVVDQAKSGSIILMHNDGEHTLEALPGIIKGLKDKGFGFTTVSNLVYLNNYYIDNAGVQHRNRG